MLRSKIGELWRTWVLKKHIMGVDKNWNKYYRCAIDAKRDLTDRLPDAQVVLVASTERQI